MLEILPWEFQWPVYPGRRNFQLIYPSQGRLQVQNGLQDPADLGAGIEANSLISIHKDPNMLGRRYFQVNQVVLPAPAFFKG